METFLHAVEKYELPSCVHGDCGGENKEVSVFMIMTRALNWGSFMWGMSKQNTCIECIWHEVATTIYGFCTSSSSKRSGLIAPHFVKSGIHTQSLVKVMIRVLMCSPMAMWGLI
ncbi:hypothetical protein EDC04DRAFT_2598388 [Pisolithus marmoratus]|nr:hypothetical protein EDC04DRAFT_2598388 [Pisolithus marmoratus]